MGKKARVIALYLPQYHPVEENDKYWGKGFTEWTNVAKAKPLFRGHDQPRIPADLGFYDLRLQEVQIEQAKLAKEAGIEGFCYWHYWFGNGKEVLEKPFDRVVKSGLLDFPFCLGWANHSWTTKSWEKGNSVAKETTIFSQEYPGEKDNTNHFYRYLDAFKDKRYIRVDDKLLFLIFAPKALPDAVGFMRHWNNLAKENGLPGFHFVASLDSMPLINKNSIKNIEQSVSENINQVKSLGFDAVETVNQKYAELKTGGKVHKILYAALRRIAPGWAVEKYDYSGIIDHFYSNADKREDVYPQLLSGWDRSPRSGKKAIVYYGTTPKTFEKAVVEAIECVINKSEEHRILFLNSWNEWGEGAYMEPDLKYGRGKLDALKKHLD